MRLTIPKDYFTGNPKPPEVYLCNTGKTIIGQLPVYGAQGIFKWGANYSEFSFAIDKTYTDVLTGEQKTHPLFNKVDCPRNIYVKNIGYFSIQDVDTEYGEKDTKRTTCFAYEYATLVHKYLNNFKINAGTVDSVEVLYNEKQYGLNYVINQDDMYQPAVIGRYDDYEKYYIKEYVDRSYVWTQKQVNNAADYATYFNDGDNSGTPLHVKAYPNVRFYWPSNTSLSLVHLILANAPEWKVGIVDTNLWHKERKFEIDRQDVYSFLTNNIADAFDCVVEFDSIKGEVNFYEEIHDGFTEDGAIVHDWDTNVIISKDNLASQINVRYSGDNIRTKFKLTSEDGVNVREVNLGSDYIMNLDYYHTLEWMEKDLYDAYSNYKQANKDYALPYETAMKNWIAANNRYHHVVNEVPAENDVVMIGDIFEKLYCVFGAINTAYALSSIDIQNTVRIENLWYNENFTDDAKIDKGKLSDGDMFVVQGYQFTYRDGWFVKGDNLAETSSLTALKEKLYLYQVHKDSEGNSQDNILLTLRNKKSDTATIRIYAPKKAIYPSANTPGNQYDDNEHYYTRSGSEGNYTYTEVTSFESKSFTSYETLYINDYKIRCVVIRNDTGLSDVPVERSVTEWLKGNLTAHVFGMVADADDGADKIPDFTISGIGTMGAYLVISKNEYVYTGGDWIPSKDYLRKYGVRLLQEKAGTYLKIFQTQTEAMYQDEGYQCIAQDTEPNGGNVAEGTRWFKTNGRPPKLYKRNGTSVTEEDVMSRWTEIVQDEEPENYENYQRYMDNFNKMVATQEVLLEKEREAEYLLDGYAVPNRLIDVNVINGMGDTLHAALRIAAFSHFCGTTAYAAQAVTNDSKWNKIDELYLNSYNDETGDRKVINKIDKTKVQNGARYNVDGYYYQYNSIDRRFERKYSKTYITTKALETYIVRDAAGNLTDVYPVLPFTTIETPFIEAYGGFNKDEIYYVKTGDAYVEKVINTQEEYDSNTDTLYVENIYAVYLKGQIPYIAYASSQGVYQMKKDYYAEMASIERFFNDDQLIRLSPFIREDEYTNSNIITTQYDSEEEKTTIFKEFIQEAAKELNTLSQPSLEFSMTMANILALPEFASLIEQFQLGKFIRVDIDGDYQKRARLLEVTLTFDNLSDFNCTFGDLKTAKAQVDLHAELLAQSVQAGSTVAKSKNGWQSAVDKSNNLEEAISTGLQNAALQVGRANGQAITWDEQGFYCRKFVDGTTDQYLDEQIAIINNKICFTRDGWKTSSAALGEFQVDINGDGESETMYGLVADAVVSGYIQGSVIKGGSLQIGGQKGDKGTFIVHSDGSVQILGEDGTAKYAAQELENAYRFRVVLKYSGQTVFYDRDTDECTITCHVYDNSEDITDKVMAQTGSTFEWKNDSKSSWSPIYVRDGGDNIIRNQIRINHDDINRNAQITCDVEFDTKEFETNNNMNT